MSRRPRHWLFSAFVVVLIAGNVTGTPALRGRWDEVVCPLLDHVPVTLDQSVPCDRHVKPPRVTGKPRPVGCAARAGHIVVDLAT